MPRKKRAAPPPAVARPGPGAPTLYRPEYCEALVEHMKGGLSYETFAAKIGTHRMTLYRWEKEHPLFCDAKLRGVDASEAFWEEVGRSGITGTLKRVTEEEFHPDGRLKRRKLAPAQFSASAWGIVMRSRFRYKERIEISRPGEDPHDLQGKSNAEIAEEARQLAEEMEAIAARAARKK